MIISAIKPYVGERAEVGSVSESIGLREGRVVDLLHHKGRNRVAIC